MFFFNFFYFNHTYSLLSVLFSRGAWRRLNDTDIVCDALSSGINEPAAYNLSFKFWRDLVVGLSIGIP